MALMTLQQFASALQEAQKLAVQLERDEAQQNLKRKTPKTYLGNSRMTLYRCEKACKLLASEGFLDIRSFMELKAREQEERKSTTANQMMSGGPMEGNEDDTKIIVLLGLVDRAQYQSGDNNKGSNVASNVEGPDLVAPTQHEHAKEEESDGEAEGPREGGNRAIVYSVSHGTAEIHGPGRVAFTRCEYAEEEEEEESSEGSEGPKELLASHARSSHAAEESVDGNAPHLTNYVQDEHKTDGGNMDMDEDDTHSSHEATSQGASNWVSDRNDGGDNKITCHNPSIVPSIGKVSESSQFLISHLMFQILLLIPFEDSRLRIDHAIITTD
ncbi:hypothetical protein EDB92DRAFT_1816970 [Lactarius akahatsu]|uniref:Uncharacterized protein n=1 Tax=Lactarius akahatsu TaxID=416441 RepID=A0AAD4LF11_9AGAM|nr:hypothetical protein EDB92DRAFT_1816970 [Lactarius akahatsu]